MKIYVIVCLIGIGIWYGYGKYAGALSPMEMALEHSRKNPNPDWSPRIQYWVGVVYFQQAKYRPAQETFQGLLKEYPTCQYAPDSLFKLNLAAQENREWEVAKGALARYIEEYPKGDNAAAAKTGLDQLRYNHP